MLGARGARHRFASAISLMLVALGALAAILLFERTLTGVRMDLTERGLYTLSPGTEILLTDLDEPITLRLYFSAGLASGLPRFTDYARYVRETLAEFERAAHDRLRVEIVDPEPFSPQEDAAAAYGLDPLPVSMRGDELYFGLVGVRGSATTEVSHPDIRPDAASSRSIAFLPPEREALLEYDIARLIEELARPRTPRVALISGLEIDAGLAVDGTPRQPWVFLEQLQSRFEVIRPDLEADDALTDVSVLILIHPRSLGASARYAIDQFVLAGGRALVFVDPNAELDPIANATPFATAFVDRASDATDLLAAWGVRLAPGQIVLDRTNAMAVTPAPGRAPVRHAAMPALGPDAFAPDDVVMARLRQINFSSPGALQPIAGAQTRLTPLISSAADSMLVDAAVVRELVDPATLLTQFSADPSRHVIAARLQGPARSAFATGGEIEPELSSGEIDILVVADTDLLIDAMWVSVDQFLGQRLTSAWASNGDFVSNAVDHLASSDALLSIRGGARLARPFLRVEALQRDAETRFLGKQRALQQELQAMERRMAALQPAPDTGAADSTQALTEEQRRVLIGYRAERGALRAELRAVQRQLTQDIEHLGARIKLLNILGAPGLILITALLLALLRRRKRELHAPSAGVESEAS